MATYNDYTIDRAFLNAQDGQNALQLPHGPCAFRDLSAGEKAPTCGCKRFWLDKTDAVGSGREGTWCYCGHHACFHDNTIAAQGGQAHVSATTAHNHNNALASPELANTADHAVGIVLPTWSELIDSKRDRISGSHRTRPSAVASRTGLDVTSTHSQSSSSITARLWQALNGFARQQEDGRMSENTTRLPSTTVPSVCDDIQSSGALVPSTQQTRNTRVLVKTQPCANDERCLDEYSATEIATPSVQGTPDLGAEAMPHMPSAVSLRQRVTSENCTQPATRPSDDRSSGTQQRLLPSTVNLGPSLSIQEMCNAILDHGRRLDILESMSFSQMPPAEIQDKFDLLDGRVLDLEACRIEQENTQATDDSEELIARLDERIQDLEQWKSGQNKPAFGQETSHAEQSSENHERLFPDDEGSLVSDGSFDENAAAQTETVVLATLAASAETGPRIDALESRIAQLESVALPSHARPWRVQVILLPFGVQLPGLWFTSSESMKPLVSRSDTQASEERVAYRDASGSSFMSVSSNGWTTESIEAWNRECARETQDDWLSPKACGPSGTVFKRLASRGLVQDVALTSPDAYHILSTIKSALGTILQEGEVNTASARTEFLGLQERFVPLRKVRKSTRLRFLSPAEITAPATWNAEFLESSIFMKVNEGDRRLYLTTPSGYIQPQSGWTWPALKSLPMHGVENGVQKAHDSGRLVEACWTFNERLDRVPSPDSSPFRRESLWANSNEESGQSRESREAIVMDSPIAQSHARSSSLPSSHFGPAASVEPFSKRRIASFVMETTQGYDLHSPELVFKRRRISSSPDLERRGVNFTPRWSREPSSPFASDSIGHARVSQLANSRIRGTTPFAYATPHSNLESRGGDDDTEAFPVEVAVSQNESADYGDEWQGMQEEPDSNSFARLGTQSFVLANGPDTGESARNCPNTFED